MGYGSRTKRKRIQIQGAASRLQSGLIFKDKDELSHPREAWIESLHQKETAEVVQAYDQDTSTALPFRGFPATSYCEERVEYTELVGGTITFHLRLTGSPVGF